MKAVFVVLSLLVVSCRGQRSPYAGRSPIGYPALAPITTTADPLGNRFGDDTPTTTIRLPIEALGSVELYNRLMKLPKDQQPFWLLNWQVLEGNRNKPQTFVQKQNTFIDTNDFNFKG